MLCTYILYTVAKNIYLIQLANIKPKQSLHKPEQSV